MLDSGGRPAGHLLHDCTISGAFTAKVHYTLNTWPAANGVRVGLLVTTRLPVPRRSETAERTSFAVSGDVHRREVRSNGTDPVAGSSPPRPRRRRATCASASPAAYLRPRRDDDGAWKPIGTAPVYPGSVSIGLQVWAGHALFHGPVKVTLSGFASRRESAPSPLALAAAAVVPVLVVLPVPFPPAGEAAARGRWHGHVTGALGHLAGS